MKRLVDLATVVAVVVASVMYGPTLLDLLKGDGAEVSDDSTPAADSDGLDSAARDRKRREQERMLDDVPSRARDAQIERKEDVVDRLKQAERNCYGAARRPGGTDSSCRALVDRVREAEEQLRAARGR